MGRLLGIKMTLFAARPAVRSALLLAAAIVIPVLILMRGSTPALACTRPPGGLIRFSVADRTLRSPVVLVGTVTSVQPPGFSSYQTATVEVEHYIKGDGPKDVKIGNLGSSALCKSSVQTGSHAIFFARGEPGDGLMAQYAGQLTPLLARTLITSLKPERPLKVSSRQLRPLRLRQR